MFTAIGMLISQKGKISNNRLMIFVMFAVVTMEAALIRLLGYNRDNVANMFSMPLLTYFLFSVILHIRCKGTVFLRLRHYSICIYLVHCSLIRFFKMIMAAMDRTLPYSVLFIAVLICSLCFAEVIYYLSIKKDIKFFKMLY